MTETKVKEHPILFSGPMVRAIIEGRKTQTRRVVKPSLGLQSTWLTVEGINRSPRLEMVYTNPDRIYGAQMEHPLGGPLGFVRCPYGQPGDLLWVRETWGAWPSRMGGVQVDSLRFRADGEYQNEHNAWRWRPSIHMPRWASRLTLRITDVRVQRVQDITYNECIYEGLTELLTDEQQTDAEHRAFGKKCFARLWDSINAKRGYSWESNPWVWAISFERVV
jgi:hypothetical protein